MADRYAPAGNNLRAAGREIHRAWILTWRIPVSAWHYWRAKRHQQFADYHREQQVLNSRTALELAERYPSLYWKK